MSLYIGNLPHYRLKYKVEVYDGSSWVEVKAGEGCSIDRDVDYISATAHITLIGRQYWPKHPDAYLAADGLPLIRRGRPIRIKRVWNVNNSIIEELRFVGQIQQIEFDSYQTVTLQCYDSLYWAIRSAVTYNTTESGQNLSEKVIFTKSGAYSDAKEYVQGYQATVPYESASYKITTVSVPAEYDGKTNIALSLSNLKVSIPSRGLLIPVVLNNWQLSVYATKYGTAPSEAPLGKSSIPVDEIIPSGKTLELLFPELTFYLPEYIPQFDLWFDFKTGGLSIGPPEFIHATDFYVAGYETTKPIYHAFDIKHIGEWGTVLEIYRSDGEVPTIDDSKYIGITVLSPFIDPETDDWYTEEKLSSKSPNLSSEIGHKVLTTDEYVYSPYPARINIPSDTVPTHIKEYLESNGWTVEDLYYDFIIECYMINKASSITLRTILEDLLKQGGVDTPVLSAAYPATVNVGNYIIPKLRNFEEIYNELKNTVLPPNYIVYSTPDGNVSDIIYTISTDTIRTFGRARKRQPTVRPSDEFYTAYLMEIGKISSDELLDNNAFLIAIKTGDAYDVTTSADLTPKFFEKEIGSGDAIYVFFEPDITPRYIDLSFQYQNETATPVAVQVYAASWQALHSLAEGKHTFEDVPWYLLSGAGSKTYLDEGMNTIDVSDAVNKPIAALKIEFSEITKKINLLRTYIYEDTDVKEITLDPYPKYVTAEFGKYVINPENPDIDTAEAIYLIDDVISVDGATAPEGYYDPYPGYENKIILTRYAISAPSLDGLGIDSSHPIVGVIGGKYLTPWSEDAAVTENLVVVPIETENVEETLIPMLDDNAGICFNLFTDRGTQLPTKTATVSETWLLANQTGNTHYVLPVRGNLTVEGVVDGQYIIFPKTPSNSFYVGSLNVIGATDRIDFVLPSETQINTILTTLSTSEYTMAVNLKYEAEQIPTVLKKLGRNDIFALPKEALKFMMTYAIHDNLSIGREQSEVNAPIDDDGYIVDFLDQIKIYDSASNDYEPAIVLATREQFGPSSVNFTFEFGVVTS